MYSIIPSIKKWCSWWLASYSTLLNEKMEQMFIQFSVDEKLNETASSLEDRNEIKTQLDRLAKWAEMKQKENLLRQIEYYSLRKQKIKSVLGWI